MDFDFTIRSMYAIYRNLQCASSFLSGWGCLDGGAMRRMKLEIMTAKGKSSVLLMSASSEMLCTDLDLVTLNHKLNDSANKWQEQWNCEASPGILFLKSPMTNSAVLLTRFETPKYEFPLLPWAFLTLYLCITEPGAGIACNRQSSLISSVITAMTLTVSC